MRRHELRSFARVLEVPEERIQVLDLLTEELGLTALHEVDLILLGGSGHYSATGNAVWLDRALDALRAIHRSQFPTFASCWGFQAMARAMGGRVVHDPARAEVGTHELFLTPAGLDDPIFAPVGAKFHGQMGHEDSVVELPANAVLLASSARVENQAYRFLDAPIYCTQFHPELNCDDLLLRVRQYPEYIERIMGLPPERFREMIFETTATEGILRRFVERYVG